MRWVIPKKLVIVSTNLTDTTNLDDDKLNTQVSKEDSFYIVLNQGLIDTISLLNISGTSIKVELLDAVTSESIKSYEINLKEDAYRDIWGYFYDDFLYKIDIFLNIILTYNMHIKVTVYNPSSTAKLGKIVTGVSSKNMDMLINHTPNMLDYSTVDRDATTGDITFKEGYYAKKLNLTIAVDNQDFGSVIKKLYDLRGKAVLFLGDGGEHSIVFGFIRNFDAQYSYKNKEYIGLTIEGLI